MFHAMAPYIKPGSRYPCAGGQLAARVEDRNRSCVEEQQTGDVGISTARRYAVTAMSKTDRVDTSHISHLRNWQKYVCADL